MNVFHLLIFIFIIKAYNIHPVEANIFESIKHFFTRENYTQEDVQPVGDITGEHIRSIYKELKKSSASVKAIKRELTKKCDDNKLMQFLAEIQVTNPESIINLSTQNELEVTCKRLCDALGEVEIYLKTCTLPVDRNLYLELIKGVAQFVDLMCEKETDTKKGFEASFDCLRLLHDDFENCYGPADWAEDIKKTDLCCAYRQIVDCYFRKAADVCGRSAAKAMKKVIVGVINVVIPFHCTLLMEPTVGSSNCKGKSIQKRENKILVIVLIICTTIKLKSIFYSMFFISY